MIYWHQAEGNNIEVDTGTGVAGEQADGEQKSPGYNMKLGFVDGQYFPPSKNKFSSLNDGMQALSMIYSHWLLKFPLPVQQKTTLLMGCLLNVR